MGLWQQLREAGFARGDFFPSGLDTYCDWIVPLLSKLPYVQPVNMRGLVWQSDELMIGLRIQQRAQIANNADLPLLAGIGAVEPE